ncbi:MAG TPA: hypothetical protein DIS78_07545 [Lachnospiraceae bacterium]|nr:hypothetical protein [Lachnospiraceae bacterium]
MKDAVNKNKKGMICLCAFLLPFMIMQVFWALNGIYPYGDNSILTGDMDLEFVNFYGYFINTFKSRSDWSYMFAKTLGGDFPGLAAFQLHDPLLFLLFLFPGEKIAAGIELIFTLQVSLAGLFMSVLLNYRYKRSWLSLLFSTAYAFMGYFFGYLVLTIYFGCLAILPLLVFFFLKYLDDNRYLVPYVLLTVYYIYLNFHMGFMLVIFLCILYLSRVMADKKYIARAPSFILSGVTILLMDGFFLLRTGLSLIGEKTTDGADYGFYRRFPLNQMFAGLFSGCAKNENMPLIYCSVAVVLFALLYLLSGKISLRDKLSRIFAIGAITVSMWINTLDAVWHGFNNPEGFYFRYAFFVSFMLIVMGYEGALTVLDPDRGEEDKTGAARIVMAAGIACLYMIWLRISGNVYLDAKNLVINAVITMFITVLALLIHKRRLTWECGLIILMLISTGDMLYNSKKAYLNLNVNTSDRPKMSVFRDDYTNINDVISYIKSYDEGFYRIEKDFDRAVNDPALFDYAGMSHDSSCEKDEIIDWLGRFGFPRTVYYTYYNGGGTSFIDSFFGIRYYVSRFDETPKPYVRLPYEGKYYAYLNEYALPLAFIAPKSLIDYDLDDADPFARQNRLAFFWGIGDDIYKEAGAEVKTEGVSETDPGHYTRNADKGFVIYDIKISEDMPLYLYFAAPGRQGAQIMINGEDRGRYFSENHWNIMCAGTYKKGDTVQVKLELLDDEIEVERPCFYYEDPGALKAFSQRAGDLNKAISGIEEIKSSHLKFDISHEADEHVVMSIPYDKCWRVTCDGRKLDTGKALSVLMEMTVPAGEHVIEMKYVPRGTEAGLVISGIGVIMFIVLCYNGRKHKKTEEQNSLKELE